MLLKMQSSVAWANIVDVGNPDAKMLVPLTPSAFEALLEKCVFTNGTDRAVVAGLYKRTIEEALSQTRELRFVSQGWTDADIAELVQVLPLCTELRRLALDDNEKLTANGAKALATALGEGAAPKLTHLGHQATTARGKLTSFARSRPLAAACAARGIVLKPFAGITVGLEGTAVRARNMQPTAAFTSRRAAHTSRQGHASEVSVEMARDMNALRYDPLDDGGVVGV